MSSSTVIRPKWVAATKPEVDPWDKQGGPGTYPVSCGTGDVYHADTKEAAARLALLLNVAAAQLPESLC